jgi:hypothetical protein
MTTATATLVAVTPGGDITEDMLAGFYTWFSVKEDLVSLARVRKAWKDAGLDINRLPKERRPEHVAQEAIRQIERIGYIDGPDEDSQRSREEIRVEQVDRTRNFLIYQVTRHVQDRADRVVNHPKAMRVIFTFADAALQFEPLDGASADDVREMAAEIRANYEKNSTKIPGHKLRTIVRHYLEEAGAENMRGNSGGVYFVAKTLVIATHNKLWAHHGDAIDGGELLRAIVAALTGIYRESDMHIIPCVNDEGQRAYLKRRFLENCTEDLKRFRDECLDVVATKDKRVRGFRTDLRDRLIQTRSAMDARRAQFASVLGETLDELDRDMTLADDALKKFVEASASIEVTDA